MRLSRCCAALRYRTERGQIQRLSGSERRALRRDCLSRIVGFAQSRSSPTLSRTRTGLDVGSVLDQELNRRSVTFICGPHQRSRSAKGFFRVHIRSMVKQRFHRVDIAGA